MKDIPQPAALMTLRTRLALPFAAIELQHIDLPGDIVSDLPEVDAYRIDFSPTPRIPAARMSFRNRWPAHRFEAVGKVFLVPPGEAAQVRSDGGTQEAVVCHLRREALDEWLDDRCPFVDASLGAGLDIRSMAIVRLMEQLGREASTPGFAQATMCEALSMQVAVELGRYHLDRDRDGTATALAGWRLALIDERLRASLAPPSLAELATLCGVSTRHLTRAFRASRGCSVGSYIRERQIEAAKAALHRGEGVKEIAHTLGFGSRSSFSHAFQKATGVAPQRFRQQRSAEQHRRPH